MKEFIFTLLQAILSAAIPILVGYLVKFLNAKASQATEKVNSDLADKYINEVTNAVTTAVIATSQTYVDALKKDNAFTKEAQSEALNMAIETALSILSPAAQQFISEVYGDLMVYLTAKIEETVRVQKQGFVLGTSVLSETEL